MRAFSWIKSKKPLERNGLLWQKKLYELSKYWEILYVQHHEKCIYVH